jgi:elongation factor Ts
MQVTPQQVKELRERTGAGMMDCKKALQDASGDLDRAVTILRERGISSAAKRAGRAAKQGSIVSYIHPGAKLGVLLELNCETDFVARTDDFRELAKDISMQIAAAAPLVVTREELPPGTVEQEREIYRNQAKSAGKPDAVVDKIVEGKLEKFYHEVCLLEQPFVKNDKETVEEVIKAVIGKVGENIVVRRFARFSLGEGSS